MKQKTLSIRKIIRQNKKIQYIFTQLSKDGYVCKIKNNGHPIIKNKILKFELLLYTMRQSHINYVTNRLLSFKKMVENINNNQ